MTSTLKQSDARDTESGMKYVDNRTGEDVPAAEVKPLGGKLFARVKRSVAKAEKKINGEIVLIDTEVESFAGYVVELADGEKFVPGMTAHAAKFEGGVR